MKVINILLGFLAVLFFGAAVFLHHAGIFSKVVIREKTAGPFVLVYEENRGHYRGAAEIQEEINRSLSDEYSAETSRAFGIYYDDPQEVERSRLRSIAGRVLENPGCGEVESLREAGLKVKIIPEGNFVTGEFPLKNRFSFFAGMNKIYPEIERHIEAKGIERTEIMEIYDYPAGRIVYLMSL